MPLLTHDETGASAMARHGALATAEREAATTKIRPQQGDGPPKPPKTRWRKIRPWALGGLGVFVLGPFIAFVIGWIIFPVPTADDTVLGQVAVYNFADQGAPVATVQPKDGDGSRIKVSFDKMPQHVRDAVLATEDKSFYSNPGFDLIGIFRAVFNQLRGGVGGGSTITQQYIKVSSGDDAGNLWRKYKEVVLAVKISKERTKDQILEDYLNTVYFGRRAYGIQAAAKAYFSKDAEKLTISEGALLAGMIQGPSIWDPAVSMPDAQRRWNGTLDNMVETGAITPAQRAEQKFPALPPPAKDQGLAGVPDDDRFKIYQAAVAEMKSHGITDEQINTAGLTVTTTLRHDRQGDAVTAVESLMKTQPNNLRAGLVSVNVKTGAIEAYYGGRGFGTDYASVLRQPGSSFKPFVFSAALQANKNIGLGSVYDGSSGREFAGQKIENSEGVSCAQCDVKTAMTKSINTVFYDMAIQVGIPKVVAAAHAAGIPEDLLKNSNAGVALGDQIVHPADMAGAFATFAADGVKRTPYLVQSVVAADGRVLYERPQDAGEQAVNPQVARNVTESMIDVAQSSRFPLADGRAVAAKTGTTQSDKVKGQNKDAWTVGYTPSISTAVWVGDDNNNPIKTSSGAAIYGSTLPGPIFQKYMNAALKGTPKESFSKLVPMGQTVAPPPPPPESTPTGTPSEDFWNNFGNNNNDNNNDNNNNDDRNTRGNGRNEDSNGRRSTRAPSG